MRSGQNASNGMDMTDAAGLAAGEANGRGGLLVAGSRKKVELVVEDDGEGPQAALNAARKLIYKDRVAAIVGPQFSSHAIPVALLAERARVVMVAPMSTNPQTTLDKRFVFRVPYLDTFQGSVIAHFAREKLLARTAAVLYDEAQDYNRTLSEVFMKVFREKGGRVVAQETYTTDRNTDFTRQLTRIAAVKPDVLFLPNYAADALLQARTARSLGITAVLLGGDGWDTKGFAAEKAFEGAFATRHWHPDLQTAKAKSFTEAYLAAFQRLPQDVAATTYDALQLLFAAAESAGSTSPEAIRQGLLGLRDYPGVTGSILYSGTGDPIKSGVIVRFRNGVESVYAVVEP
jgi:branched-chain amino acid transport system substrate-binding protein